MKTKIYEFSEYFVEKKAEYFELVKKDDFLANEEREKLFSIMLNFGYISFQESTFKISDKDIVDFWNYANSSALKNLTLCEYYNILEISPLYEKKIPTLKETENLMSSAYQLTVVWINDTSKFVATSPKKYERKGLELYFEEENIGSLFPEYYALYEIVDNANVCWKNWSKSDRYDFFKKLQTISEKRKVILPDMIRQELAK